MAYTLKLLDATRDGVQRLKEGLLAVLDADNRFVINDIKAREWFKTARYRTATHEEVTSSVYYGLELRRVRLREPKPYCGNHPGPCEVNPFRGPDKKMNARYLEWNDWVAFHKLVNDVLTTLHFPADVWSTPQDCKGKMWIRKGTRPRIRYDYEQRGRFRVWNTGDESQFEPLPKALDSGYRLTGSQ